jgi:hypothetical protein
MISLNTVSPQEEPIFGWSPPAHLGPDMRTVEYVDAIRAEAYRIYCKRIHEDRPGSDLEDWLTAENAIRTRFTSKD